MCYSFNKVENLNSRTMYASESIIQLNSKYSLRMQIVETSVSI